MRKMSLSRFVSTQVTEVVFWDDFLFVGQGSRLRVFDVGAMKLDPTPNRHLLSYPVFQTRSVHAIKPGHKDFAVGKSTVQLCVTGGRFVRIINFDYAHPTRLRKASPVIKFQDWVLDVRWLLDKRDFLVILTAQNYVILWDSVCLRQIQLSRCEQNCILYSGIIVGESWNDLAIFSGTVFSEVLVWNPENGFLSQPLKGHSGVIFSINYNATLRKLCTSSDDRTVQIWTHNLDEAEADNCTSWKKSSFLLLSRLYGHEARVWKVLDTRKWVISAGEDSLLCFWTHGEQRNNGQLCRKISAHNGSSIRSLSVNGLENLLATGGENGGLKVWNIDQHLSEMCYDTVQISPKNESKRNNAAEQDYPRTVRFLDALNVFIVSNNGIIFNYSVTDKKMNTWLQDEKFKSYSVVDITNGASECLAAIGNLNGEITIIEIKTFPENSMKHPEFSHLGSWKLQETKILALKWLNRSSLLTCTGSQGRMDLFTVTVSYGVMNSILTSSFQLPVCRQRWFSAAAILENGSQRFLFCGSRGGSLFLYTIEDKPKDTIDLPTDGKKHVQSFQKIHGMHGVTHIHASNDEDFVLTTGRDGFIRTFVFRNGALREMNKLWVSGCSKWIAGMFLSNDLLVYGFHADNFVLWSERHEISVLEIPCGGGHRCWDFSIRNDVALFAYVKKNKITICRTRLKHRIPSTIKAGSHIRRICDVHCLFTLENSVYFATVSDDTTVKISAMRIPFEEDEEMDEVATLKTHISSVRAIASCALTPKDGESSTLDGDRLIVTCGGRAQMVVWILRAANRPKSFRKVLVEQVTSHMLHSDDRRFKKPWLEENYVQDPETRYMDVAVWPTDDSECYVIAVCCSDSYLRLFGLNVGNRSVKVIAEDSRHGHCLLKLNIFRLFAEWMFVVTTATDGKAIVWDVTPIERTFVHESIKQRIEMSSTQSGDDQESEEVDCAAYEAIQLLRIVHELRLHQSGVTALDVRIVAESSVNSTIAIATGGDDTALNLVILKFDADLAIKEVSRSTIQTAHSSQITDILILADDLHVVTVSGDQRLSTWRIRSCHDDTAEKQTVVLELENCVVSSVADISSAAILSDKDNRHLIAVAGMGLEIFETTLKCD